jgi:hypothetical protein
MIIVLLRKYMYYGRKVRVVRDIGSSINIRERIM